MLGLASDRVYQWRLLLEELAPEILYISKGYTTQLLMLFHNVSTTQKPMPPMNKILPTLQSSPRIANVGKDFQHYGVLIMRTTPANINMNVI